MYLFAGDRVETSEASVIFATTAYTRTILRSETAVNEEVVVATIDQTILEELFRLVVHVEPRDQLVANGICHTLDDGVSVWWVITKIIGKGIRVN